MHMSAMKCGYSMCKDYSGHDASATAKRVAASHGPRLHGNRHDVCAKLSQPRDLAAL